MILLSSKLGVLCFINPIITTIISSVHIGMSTFFIFFKYFTHCSAVQSQSRIRITENPNDTCKQQEKDARLLHVKSCM